MSSPALSLPQEDASGVAARWRDVLRRLVPFLRPHAGALAFALGLLAVSTTVQLALPLLLRRVLDVDLPARDADGLLRTVLSYVVVLGVYVVVSYLLRTRLEVVGQAVLLDLRTRLFDRLLRHAVSFHDRNPPGRLIARVQGDTDALRQLFTGSVVGLIEGAVLLVGMLVVLAVTSGRLALVVGALVPVPLLLTLVLARAGARSFRVVREKAADVADKNSKRPPLLRRSSSSSREQDGTPLPGLWSRTLGRRLRARRGGTAHSAASVPPRGVAPAGRALGQRPHLTPRIRTPPVLAPSRAPAVADGRAGRGTPGSPAPPPSWSRSPRS